PLLLILCCYYIGLFVHYYRKTKKVKTALRNTVILLLPLLLVFFLIEFGFRVLVSNKIMHLDKRFFTRNFAAAYYFIHGEKQGLIRHIRLRETEPFTSRDGYIGKDFY